MNPSVYKSPDAASVEMELCSVVADSSAVEGSAGSFVVEEDFIW